MSTVDNRIVNMGFENSQFTKAANSTMDTLKKLSDSLKLTEGTSGLENLASKAKSVDMSPLASGVESLTSKLSAMDIVGVTALVNIANSAINTGKTLVSSLTIDPITDGFREYETKMNALQTIMTNTESKGTTMDEIKASLSELNKYSDLTIYNFAQMTDNIGKFTAAGVGLEDSVVAIKGMANVAAGFGVDATRMAGATYQMSQMLQAGKMMAIDWNSMTQAGMGGDKLQKAFLDTAESMGIVSDQSKGFKLSLEEGWLTSEVFIETMKKMAEDPSLLEAAQNVTSLTKLIGVMQETVGSSWAMSWEHIFGDKDQSTKLFTGISNSFRTLSDGMAEYRNEALQTWNATGGREAVLNGLSNALQSIGRVLKPIHESYKKIIDPWNGAQLTSLSKAFESWTDKIKLSDGAIENLSKTFDGIFSLFSIGGKVIGGIVQLFAGFIPLMMPIVEGLLSITAPIGDFIVKLNDTVSASGVFKSAMSNISKVALDVSHAIGNTLTKLGTWIGGITGIDLSGLKKFSDKIVECFTPIEYMVVLVESAIDGIKNALGKIVPVIIKFATKVWEVLNAMSKSIIDTMGGQGNAITNIMSAGLLGAIIVGIKKVIDIFKNLTENAGGMLDSIVGIFDGVKGSLEAFQNDLKANTLLKLAGAIALLAASLLIISTIDSAKLIASLTAMGTMFGELVGAMALLDKVGGGAKVGIGMMILATSVLILSKALKNIADVPWEDSLKGLFSLSVMMGMLVAASKTMETNSKGMMKTAIAMVIFAKAINVLSEAVKFIGGLDVQTIGKGLIGLGVMMAELSLFMKTTDLSGMSMGKAIGILILAQSLMTLSKAVQMMGGIDSNQLIKGLSTIGLLLVEISLYTKLMGNPAGMISTSIGVAILGGALIILATAVGKMGSLSLETIGKGILTMAASLVVIAGAMRIMPKNITMQAVSIAILSGALLVLGTALTNMGSMSWDNIAKGLTTLAGSLTILAIATKLMSSSIAGAVAIVIVAGALALLTPCLIALGSLSMDEIGRSLLVLAGAFVVIGLAGLVLGPLTPVLLALAGTIALFGIACMAVGIGISAFAAGISLLAVSGTAGAAALVVIVTSLVGLIPMVATAIAQGLVNVIKVFLDNAAILASAVVSMVTTIIKALTAAIPVLVDFISVLLTNVLQLLVEQTPNIVESVITIIVRVLETLKENLPKIAGIVVEYLVDLFVTVVNEIKESIPKISDAIIGLIEAIINSWSDNIKRITDAVWDFVINMINGFTDSIEEKMPQVRAAVKRLVHAIGEEFKAGIKDAADIGGYITDGLKNGISNGIEKVKNAAREVARGALDAAKSFLGIFSPSREFKALGMYSSMGLANGLSDYGYLVEKESAGVGQSALDVMRNALSGINSMINDSVDAQPVIRPVMDLSDVTAGVSRMNSSFGDRNLSVGLAGMGNIRGVNIQNNSYDVVSAIKDLKKSISNMGGGNSYNVNGITYDDGSNVSSAIESLVRAAKIERRT